MTYEDAKKFVATKHGLGSTLVTGHRESYFKEAAMLYASQQRTEGIREGFEAARDRKDQTFALVYQTIEDYLNSKNGSSNKDSSQ